MDKKFVTFLRLEICVNRLKDLGLNKGLENLNALRQKLGRGDGARSFRRLR
jgi:hypothetical protein